MHDIENCCSFLYICLWLFKYTKTSAVFFYFILTLSLEMSDDPNYSLIDKIPPNGVSFSDFICTFAMSIVGFSCLFCNTKISEFFDITKSWATFYCSGT